MIGCPISGHLLTKCKQRRVRAPPAPAALAGPSRSPRARWDRRYYWEGSSATPLAASGSGSPVRSTPTSAKCVSRPRAFPSAAAHACFGYVRAVQPVCREVHDRPDAVGHPHLLACLGRRIRAAGQGDAVDLAAAGQRRDRDHAGLRGGRRVHGDVRAVVLAAGHPDPGLHTRVLHPRLHLRLRCALLSAHFSQQALEPVAVGWSQAGT